MVEHGHSWRRSPFPWDDQVPVTLPVLVKVRARDSVAVVVVVVVPSNVVASTEGICHLFLRRRLSQPSVEDDPDFHYRHHQPADFGFDLDWWEVYSFVKSCKICWTAAVIRQLLRLEFPCAFRVLLFGLLCVVIQ